MDAIRIVLKNISQVLLLNNAWTGLFILLGLFIGSWKVGVMALIASVIALLLAKGLIIQKKKSIQDYQVLIQY